MDIESFKKSNGLSWANDNRFHKSEYAIGTIRTWSDGKKYQKQGDGSWKEVKEKETGKSDKDTMQRNMAAGFIEAVGKTNKIDTSKFLNELKNNDKDVKTILNDFSKNLSDHDKKLVEKFLNDKDFNASNNTVSEKPSSLFDPETVNGEDVKSKIEAPVVRLTVSRIGGKGNASIMLTISLDKASDWPNGYIQNSRYMNFRIDEDGTIDQFQRSGISKKFIKRKVKSVDDAISKINIYLKEIDVKKD